MFATVLDADRQRVPVGLAIMPPGPALAAALANIDVEALSGHDQVVVLRAHRRMASHYQAQGYRDMAAIADTYAAETPEHPDLAFDGAAAEIGAALCLTRRGASGELAEAQMLVGRYSRLWEWFHRGLLDARRVRAVLDSISHLEPHVADAVLDRIAAAAPRMTTGQLRAWIRRLAVEADPEDAHRRCNEAMKERRVVAEPSTRGTTHLMIFDLAPDEAAAAAAHLDRLARHLRSQPGETRTMDQLRADVASDLLQGRPGNVALQVSVEVTVDLETLARLSDRPAELRGYGPIVADLARRLAHTPGARWQATVHESRTGDPAWTGPIRRRPTTIQARHVRARYPTCVWPGCRMPAAACDLDHRTPWADGGPTTADNLAPLCRHHHRLRHQHNWTYERLPDGHHRWTTPTDHTYTTPARGP